MKLKRYKKKTWENYVSRGLILIFISLLCAIFIINDFAKRANNILLPMAEAKTRKVVTMIINSACSEDIIKDNLYVVNRNDNNEIEMITYNSFEVTKLINEVTFNIEKKIRDIEEGRINYYGDSDNSNGGIIATFPFGIVYGNAFFNNIGPKINLRLEILGDIMSNIETEVKPYGINNAYIEVRIHLTLTARIVLPFVSEKVVISNVIPISMTVVHGSVPDGYIYSYK